jgi:hypothetical protein
MKRFFLLVFLLICTISVLRGTHIVGGEITYKCLGGDQYEISLTVYRDCYTTRLLSVCMMPTGT